MPRPTIEHVDSAVAHLQAGMTTKSIKTFYGDPMEVVSSCLRGAFVARKDHLLFSIDFSQIEARVLAWLAGQQNIVDAFAKGEDVYTLTANEVGSHDRFLGKVLVLACGYQMGGPKFHETATKFGLEITEHDAKIAVALWRQVNDQIVGYWEGNHALLRSHAQISEDMPITLKSGRVLPYRNVHFIGDGDIAYVGLNTYTHKWGDVKIYGGKLVENIVQATARDVMTDAMIRIENFFPKAHLIMTVHDELVYEVHKDHFVDQCPDTTLTSLEDFIKATPVWAKGLPIAVEGWHGRRYRK
jgi:DNA polymerase